MKRVLILLLVVSLAINLWLWRRSAMEPSPAMAVEKQVSVKAEPGLPVATLETGDVAAIRDALRAAGVDESTIRGIVEGVLRQRLHGQLAAEKIERARHAWWRNGRAAAAGDAAAMKAKVTGPLRSLLGPDPLDAQDAESRYSFLRPDKRQKLGQIDRDYAELQASRPPNLTNAQLRAAAKEEQLLTDERRKDVIAALTPEEKAEFDLRFSETAGLVSRRMAAMGATEAEYRLIKPLLDDFNRQAGALPKGENFSSEAYNELQRAATQRLVATLGYDRAVAYLWSGYDAEYSALSRAAADAQLPPDTPVRVMELALDVGQEAARVHEDPALTPEQKRAALPALQQSAQARLDALLSPAAHAALPADGLRWLSDLGEGKYRVPMPTLLSSGSYYVHTITAPPPSKPDGLPPALPPRPTGK